MNRCVLIGRPTKDPELRFLSGSGTAVATFTLAVDRTFKNASGEKEADFIPIVVWRKQAESVANYVAKGSLIGISGRIQTRTYDAQDGTKRYVTEVVADEVQFLSKKNEQSSNNTANSSSSNDDDLIPVNEGDIPF